MQQPSKPFAPACEENKGPILAVLAPLFRHARSVLEIGSGTGQHAVCFAAAMPQLRWQTSDRREQHAGIRLWLDEAALPNLPPPLPLDVVSDPWPADRYDAAFSANTAHIMDWAAVAAMFRGVGSVLARNGVFALYGPFNYGGRYTSESNARFDAQLRQGDPRSGIRDLNDLKALAAEAGMTLVADHPMPVNNRTLVWRRVPAAP
jgi:hypothetical protein